MKSEKLVVQKWYKLDSYLKRRLHKAVAQESKTQAAN